MAKRIGEFGRVHPIHSDDIVVLDHDPDHERSAAARQRRATKEGGGMRGLLAALLITLGIAGPLRAQLIEPPTVRPTTPVDQPPTADRPPPRLQAPVHSSPAESSPTPSRQNDLPPAPVRFTVSREHVVTTASLDEDEPKPTEVHENSPLKGDEVFGYLKEGRRNKESNETPPSTSSFGGRLREWFDGGCKGESRWFKSDHSFDSFISPVTNPFLFEDPRSISEIRPTFMYQKIPSSQQNFQGGNMYFIGTQARIAVTDRFSITLNKIGGEGISSSGSSTLGSNFGLTEIWIGPKYTFYRDVDEGTVLAGGAIFQLPYGSSSVYQNTGNLSINPYVSGAQKLYQMRAGDLNGLATVGYSFAGNHNRSDYFYVSGHVDWDIGNMHRFYPLLEANWFTYTSNGQTSGVVGEGRDLVNFGSASSGTSLVTGAVGGRIKLTKNAEIGGAFEFPMFGNRDYFNYRFTVDFIWRFW